MAQQFTDRKLVVIGGSSGIAGRLTAEFQCRPEMASQTRRSRCTPRSATTWPRPA